MEINLDKFEGCLIQVPLSRPEIVHHDCIRTTGYFHNEGEMIGNAQIQACAGECERH
jgi:hypothetical protein